MKKRSASPLPARHAVRLAALPGLAVTALPAARALALLLAGLAAGLSTTHTARADTYTWTGGSGGSGNFNWSAAGNWLGNAAPPVNGLTSVDLIFGNAAYTVSSLDNAYSVLSLSFASSASAFAFTGGSLTLGGGGLNQNSANAQVFGSTAVILGASQTWTLASGSGALSFGSGVNTTSNGTSYALTIDAATTTGSGNVLNGAITGGGSLTKKGAGTLTLTGASTYTGDTTVSQGTLAITGSVTGGGLLTVDGTGTAKATLNLRGANSSLRTGNVIVGYAGIGTLNQSGGSFDTSGTGSVLDDSSSFTLGNGIGSSGTYTLSGTGSLNTGRLFVGNLGSGTLNLSGGTLTAGDTTLGNSSFGDGTSGASYGSGTVNQSGGSFSTGIGSLTLGNKKGTSGTYNLSGGTLATGQVSGFSTATSTFHFNGGTLQPTQATVSFFQGLTTADVQAGGAIIDTQNYNVAVAQSLTSGTPGGYDGGLTKLGAGTLILRFDNTYTGATTISAGTLQVGIGSLGGSLGQNLGPITDNGTLAYNRSDSVTLTNAISGTGGLTQLGPGKLTLSGAITYTGATTVSAGTLAFTGTVQVGSRTSALTVDGVVFAPTLTLSAGTLDASVIYVGKNNVGTVTQSGGTVTSAATVHSQSGDRTSPAALYVGYGENSSGTYNLQGGTLNTGAAYLGYLNGAGGHFTQTGGTFNTNANRLSVGGLKPGTYVLVNGSLSSGEIDLNNGSFIQSGGTVQTNGNSLFLGIQDGAGTYTLNGGALTTGAVETGYDGTTGTSTFNFNGGTLIAAATNTTFMQGLTTAYVQAGGAIISIPGAPQGAPPGGTAVQVTIGQALLHDPALGSTDDGGLRINGAGTLTLTGANTFTGPTRFDNGGTLILANALALQNSTLSLDSGTVVFSSAVSGHAFTLGGLGSYGGGLSLQTDSNVPVALSVGNNNENSVYGGSLTGSGSLTKIGTGTLQLAGTNNYQGRTTVAAGTLEFGFRSTLYYTTSTTTVNATASNLTVMAGATAAFGVGRSDQFTSAQIGALAALGTATGGFRNGSTLGLKTSGATSPVTISANLANPNGEANALALAKLGSGTLILTGNNTYTGGTTVSAGTLLVANTSGSATGTWAVTVNNAGTVLGGTGTIAGAVTVNSGAALLGGDGSTASGALTLQAPLTLNSGSVIELTLGASGTHSTLARGDSSSVAWTFANNQAFTFVNSGAAQTGAYDNIITGLSKDPTGERTWTITNEGFTGSFLYDGMGNIDLKLIVVPEPATWAGGALLLGVAGWSLRRRCRACGV